jgi:hypothetical protein
MKLETPNSEALIDQLEYSLYERLGQSYLEDLQAICKRDRVMYLNMLRGSWYAINQKEVSKKSK